jgi:hypothetical protein
MSFLNENEYEQGKVVEKDVVPGTGFKPMESNIYDFTIKLAYFSTSAKGAKAVNLEMHTDAGDKRRFTVYMTNQQGSVKYKDKKGEMQYLPGFLTVDGLCLLTVGKSIMQLQKEVQTKTINLYDFNQKKEVATDVEMLVPLLEKRVKVGIIKKRENKTKKNESTGKYEPINEERFVNEISKVFRERDNKTVSEILGKMEKAIFIDEWLGRWENQTDDRYKEVAQAGNAGVPGAAFGGGAATSSEPAGTTAGQDDMFL